MINELKESLGMTFVVVSHELASIFNIADDAIFLDAKSKTLLDQGHPDFLLNNSKHSEVIDFLIAMNHQAIEMSVDCFFGFHHSVIKF